MTKDLLWRGLLAGLIAAVCATLFARALGEPAIDLAIAFEAAHAAHGSDEVELVSRATQKGLGLLTALSAYGAAVGGLFALVFALCYGRVTRMGPRALALTMAGLGFCALSLFPALKYPSTPPAVGHHETVAMRTAAHFAMLAASGLALWAALWLRGWLAARIRSLDATLAAATAYVGLVIAAQALLPAINEVPADFPATVLWDFRLAAMGLHAVLWLVIGVVFGRLSETVLRRA